MSRSANFLDPDHQSDQRREQGLRWHRSQLQIGEHYQDHERQLVQQGRPRQPRADRHEERAPGRTCQRAQPLHRRLHYWRWRGSPRLRDLPLRLRVEPQG